MLSNLSTQNRKQQLPPLPLPEINIKNSLAAIMTLRHMSAKEDASTLPP